MEVGELIEKVKERKGKLTNEEVNDYTKDMIQLLKEQKISRIITTDAYHLGKIYIQFNELDDEFQEVRTGFYGYQNQALTTTLSNTELYAAIRDYITQYRRSEFVQKLEQFALVV